MWERAVLKERAKKVLSGSYWKAFLVSIVAGFFTGGSSAASGNSGRSGIDFDYGTQGFNIDVNMMAGIIVAAIIGVLIVALVLMVVNIFIGYNIRVGAKRYFVQAAQGDVDMGNLGYGFKSGRYINIVKSMLWRGFLNFLWYLLLYIPGVIKSYAYSMVPYILADNPDIGSKRALDLSIQMTDGEKWDIFVLNLSFIGWYLLGILACAVGIVFVVPYQNSTEAELYLVLRDKAVENGFCDYRELNLVRQIVEDEWSIDEEF